MPWPKGRPAHNRRDIDTSEVAALYEAGWGLDDLQAKYQCTNTVVYRALVEHDVTMRPWGSTTGPRTPPPTEIVGLYEADWSMNAIGRRFGISPHKVKQYLVDHGVPLRNVHNNRTARDRAKASRRRGPSTNHPGRRLPHLPAAEVVAEYSDGASIVTISRRHNVSYGAVRARLIAAGVTLRSRLEHDPTSEPQETP